MPFLCATAFAVTTVAALTLLFAFVGIFVGPARFRSTRMWLLLTALVAGWLGLIMIWPEVYWRGQQHRAGRELLPAGKMVESLNAHWPSEDDELPNLGPFMAYPKGDVRVLMPLAGAHFPGTDVAFSAVERTGNDVMRFELAGGESDAWLEWRRDDSEPKDFVGGLESQYTLGKVARLAPHWFLVRYRAGRKG
jgi:energy-coupling factor transporter transmembrane protein EcfT